MATAGLMMPWAVAEKRQSSKSNFVIFCRSFRQTQRLNIEKEKGWFATWASRSYIRTYVLTVGWKHTSLYYMLYIVLIHPHAYTTSKYAPVTKSLRLGYLTESTKAGFVLPKVEFSISHSHESFIVLSTSPCINVSMPCTCDLLSSCKI